jgi:hypothetical protein
MAVRLSALRAGHFFTPQEDSWYSFNVVTKIMLNMRHVMDEFVILCTSYLDSESEADFSDVNNENIVCKLFVEETAHNCSKG